MRTNRPAWYRDEQRRMDGPGVTSGRFQARSAPHDQDDRDGAVTSAVARAAEGDREAIRYLYIRYADNVYAYVRTIVRDDHEAEDVTQQVFGKLITVIARYEDRGLPFSAWILRVARNMAVDHLRSSKLVPCEEVRVTEVRADQEDRDRSRALIDALSALPEDQREVLYLRHVLGLSPDEIAERIDRSEASVHGLHHRGRRVLTASLRGADAAPSTRPAGLAIATA
jgi:RNA polymerase sigma-70 factor, ECF subfamily